MSNKMIEVDGCRNTKTSQDYLRAFDISDGILTILVSNFGTINSAGMVDLDKQGAEQLRDFLTNWLEGEHQ